MKILQAFGNYNPSGIIINEGWLALAACVYGDLTAEEALFRICGSLGRLTGRQSVGQGHKRSDAIMDLYRKCPGISQREIAKQLGCSRSLVAYVLNIKNSIYVRGRKAAR